MKNQSKLSKIRWIIMLGVTILLLAASATWAMAESDGTINACVTISSGAIRIVSDPTKCKRTETSLTWNILGQKGDQGDPGVAGPIGPAGLNGLACWDLNGDGTLDPAEDINQDGLWNAADCRGAQGDQGIQGPAGPQGEPGPMGSGIASLEQLAGLPCQVGLPGAGLTTLEYDPSNGNATVTCNPATLYTLTIVKTGGFNSAVISDPAGINCGETCSYTFPAGRVISLSNDIGSGDQFVGWGSACSGTGDCQVSMVADTVVTANFVTEHSLQLELIFGEYGEPFNMIASGRVMVNGTQECALPTCLYTFQEGETVTFQAIPDFGSQLMGWYGACEGEPSDTCTLTIDNTDPIEMWIVAVFGIGY